MKKTVSFIFLFSLACTCVFGQIDNSLNPLVTGVPSLSIAPDARGGGMGDVGAATTPDINSQYWNPSKYAFMEDGAGFSLSYTPWLRKLVSDINLSYLAGYYKIGEFQAISASLRYFSLGQVQLTDNTGNSVGSTNPAEFALDIAYSRKLSDKWAAGVALRYINSNLGGGEIQNMYPGSAFAADISTYYTTTFDVENGDSKFGFGANLSNIGSKISYDKGDTKLFLPTNLRVGVSYEYPLDNYNTLSISSDVNKLLVPSDTTTTGNHQWYYNISPVSGMFKSFSDGSFMQRLQVSVGAEYTYNKQFSVRSGYYYESELSGNRRYFTFGAGFKLNVFNLDLAYVVATSQTNPLDQTLRFSLGFNLEGMKNLLK